MALGNRTHLAGATKPDSISADSYEGLLFAKRITEIPTNMQGRWEYDTDDNCIYAGYGARGLEESDTGWLLHKFTWASGNCTKREIGYNSWDNRATAEYK